MKKNYEAPALQMEQFETTDVITVSLTPLFTFHKSTSIQKDSATKVTLGDMWENVQ